MSNNNNETTTEINNIHKVYFEFLKENGEFVLNENGKPMLALIDDYRGTPDDDIAREYSASVGNGSELELPEMLVIPEVIDGTTVEVLAPGMFASNTRVKNIMLPSTIDTIPEYFCCYATNLQGIYGTDKIKTINKAAFRGTRIRNVKFPQLNTLASRAFYECVYLESADIGAVITISSLAFFECALLREVIWKPKEVEAGEKVEVSIDEYAFAYTRSLKELPLLAYATSVAQGAFFYSSIRSSLPAGNGIDGKAFPTFDNTTDFWSGVKFTPRRNRITTKLNQINSAWAEDTFLLDEPKISSQFPYQNSCAFFAVMHIHSAITGKYYSHPDEFVAELTENGLSQFLYYNKWPGQFENVAPMFEALGYRTEVHGSNSDLNRHDYKALVDALADGAYVYTQVATYSNWRKDWDESKPNGGHAVAIYGINDGGEVCVLDSLGLHAPDQEHVFEPEVDIYTYTMPYQNMVGPSSNFVIVYPPEEEPSVNWTGYAAVNTFTADSKPSDYPENQVTISYLASDKGIDGYKQGILTAYRVGNGAFRTFVPKIKPTMYLQIKPSDAARDEWLEWTECNHQDFTRVSNNKISLQMMPDDLPTGVNICGVTAGAFPEDTKGYLTTYKLFSSFPNAREEWQPNGSMNKYIRYATSTGAWSDWYTITPSFTVNMQATDVQYQYAMDQTLITITELLNAINNGAVVRCDISVDGVRYLLPLASVHSADDQTVLTYGLNMGNTQVTVIQTGNTATASVTAQAE